MICARSRAHADVSAALVFGIRVIDRSPKPSRITLHTRAIIASFFGLVAEMITRVSTDLLGPAARRADRLSTLRDKLSCLWKQLLAVPHRSALPLILDL